MNRLKRIWPDSEHALIQHRMTAEAENLFEAARFACLKINRPYESFRIQNKALTIDVLRGFDIPHHGQGQYAVITEKETGFAVILRGELIKRNFDDICGFEFSEDYINDMKRICHALRELDNDFENAELKDVSKVSFIDQETSPGVTYIIDGRECNILLRRLCVVTPSSQNYPSPA